MGRVNNVCVSSLRGFQQFLPKQTGIIKNKLSSLQNIFLFDVFSIAFVKITLRNTAKLVGEAGLKSIFLPLSKLS